MRNLETDGLLKQLGYSVNIGTIGQLEKIINNTKGFSHIKKHILPLNDELKIHQSYIAMSNTVDMLKIKSEATNHEIKKEVRTIINKWATKYKVDLEKVANKETYYIKGFLRA